MQYEDYLKTKHWEKLRTQKRKKHERCGICATKEHIDTHHLLYRDLWSVTTEDLRLLCHRCHFLAHDLMKAGKIKFRNDSAHSRWGILKHAVKMELGLGMNNCFRKGA